MVRHVADFEPGDLTKRERRDLKREVARDDARRAPAEDAADAIALSPKPRSPARSAPA